MMDSDSVQNTDDEIIISYLPDNSQSIYDKKFKRKLLLALITFLFYLIIIGLVYWKLILQLWVVAIPLIIIVLPLSFSFEHKSIKKKIIQIPLALIIQVLVPTLIVIPFDRSFGLITISVFFISVIFLILDFVFVKSSQGGLYEDNYLYG